MCAWDPHESGKPENILLGLGRPFLNLLRRIDRKWHAGVDLIKHRTLLLLMQIFSWHYHR